MTLSLCVSASQECAISRLFCLITRLNQKSGICAYLSTIFVFSALNAVAQADFSESLSGVRIGMWHPSGIVVWPVDSSPDDAAWFDEKNSSIRDRRRRQAEKMSDDEIMAWPGFRSLSGKSVKVVIGDASINAKVGGIARIRAGCGEFEPSWYASTIGSLDKNALESFKDRGFSRDWLPALVLTEQIRELRVHAAKPQSEWPPNLMSNVREANIPLIESRIVRIKNIWIVYTHRVVQPARLGATRTIWSSQGDTYVKLHEDRTNATIENYLERLYTYTGEIKGKLQHYRSVLGHIHALIETEESNMYLTKYRSYESDSGILERLENGQMQTIRVDGFDRGC